MSSGARFAAACLENTVRFFNETLVPIYADVVALTAKKPINVAVEIEAAFFHLAKASSTENPRKLEYLTRSKAHLERAALDAAKLLWLNERERIEKLIGVGEFADFAVYVGSADLLQMHLDADNMAAIARRIETEDLGFHPPDAIRNYYESAHAYGIVLERLDVADILMYRLYRLCKHTRIRSDQSAGWGFESPGPTIAWKPLYSVEAPAAREP